LPNGLVLTPTYDAIGRLREVADDEGLLASYQYDANGNVVYQGDALGRRVHTIEYVDATTGASLDGLNGNPPPRKTRHLYAGLETVEEYLIEEGPSADTATLLREFVWGDPRSFPDPRTGITPRT
jgi:YD repeat-containing protein